MEKDILIIDDEPLTCEIYREFLEAEGYKIDIAYDGNTGLAKLRGGDYALVLLDIKMHGLSGLEVLEEIRKEGIEIKVIIITGIIERDVERRCISLGANQFLTKPINLQSLKEVIEKTLATNSTP